jgi:TrmH family RNA methyltransferase
MLEQIRIVLVRPQGPANVGAAARIMMNMGLSDLVLVAPRCDPLSEPAEAYAMRAKPLLQRARIVEDIPDALRDCVLTFAASAKAGVYRRQAATTPREAAHLAAETAAKGAIAIALGPEDRGLVQSELLHFDRVLEIPADPQYPALNLAAAAAVICYELRQAALSQRKVSPFPEQDAEPLAADERKRILYERLFSALERIGFFRTQQNPNHLRFAIRRVFGRVDMTVNEVDVLIGMASQMHWYADHYGPPPADE